MGTLGDRLREAREKKNLKQIQVKEHTGINNKTLSGYENNVSEPDFETLRILSAFYEADIDELLEGKKINSSKKHLKTQNESILRDIVDKYDIDLTKPGAREKLEQIIRLVLEDHSEKQ